MATFLQNMGYATFYGGKYLNQYGHKETGGVERIPPGYDRWIGLVGNSHYYNYTLSVDGHPVHHGDDYHNDYLTDILAKEALDFIARHISPEPAESPTTPQKDSSFRRRPMFLTIAPPACHSPFTPAPQFSRRFASRKAPRWPSFNRHPGQDKHWLVRQAPYGPLPQEVIDNIDNTFRERWRTLLSVDQMVGEIVKLLRKTGELDRTAIILTSDHGYHLGQFTLPLDKRLPYETDIRVPLIIKPPRNNNRKMIIESLAVVSIDLAPTVLDMAGISTPHDMDGTSLLPLLRDKRKRRVRGRRINARKPIQKKKVMQVWRTSFLVEYHGEAGLADIDPQCPRDPQTTLCLYDYGCKCQDAANNTYACLRTLAPHEDSLYCHFVDQERFVEMYDLRRDPYQLNNTAYSTSTTSCIHSPSHQDRLERLSKCQGYSECSSA